LLRRCHSSPCFELEVVIRVSEESIDRLLSLGLYFLGVSCRVLVLQASALHNQIILRRENALLGSMLSIRGN